MKKKKIIIILVLFLLFNIYLNSSYNINISSIFKDIFYFLNRLPNNKEITLDNNSLLSEIDTLKSDITELKKVIDLKESNSTYSMIYSSVINRTMKNFYNELTLDKGYKDGIRINDSVITNEGLVGKITSISNYTSTVKLITSSDIYNMISVTIKTKDKDIYGVLNSYDNKSNSFTIEGIDELVKVKEGDLVVTTGLGENYPSGLVIGKVIRISKDNFDLAYILKVEPAVNFDSFHYVAVLNREND